VSPRYLRKNDPKRGPWGHLTFARIDVKYEEGEIVGDLEGEM
jgi:hypothetical protein